MIEDWIITEKITDYSGVLFKTEDMGKEFCSPSIELKMPENWTVDKAISGLAYMKFQSIIHDYIDGIEATTALNEEILEAEYR
jgi:hypothetical protein